MGCIAHDGWIMNSDFMQTVSMNADDVFLVASLEIGGFHFSQHTVNDGSGESDTLTADNAELSFVFDTVCSDRSCEFLFFMVSLSFTGLVLKHDNSAVWSKLMQ